MARFCLAAQGFLHEYTLVIIDFCLHFSLGMRTISWSTHQLLRDNPRIILWWLLMMIIINVMIRYNFIATHFTYCVSCMQLVLTNCQSYNIRWIHNIDLLYMSGFVNIDSGILSYLLKFFLHPAEREGKEWGGSPGYKCNYTVMLEGRWIHSMCAHRIV